MNENMEIRGKQLIQSPWFDGLIAVLEYFHENVEQQKEARIVIEYDPRKGRTEITYYRAMEPQSREEGL